MKKSLYIFKSGELRRKDDTLYFDNEEERRVIPIEDTYDIYIFGEVDVTKRFLEFVSQKEVCIHYFNYYGYYIGTFYPREHLNAGHVVVKQAEHYINMDKRVHLARKFVEGAISQMRQVIRYYKSRIKSDANDFKSILNKIDKLSKPLLDATTVEELMAIEGHVREMYYKSFDQILDNPDFPFEKRSNRPPLNRLNALISFGNSICYTLVLSEIFKTYLDPRIGYLHSSNFRRFSLNLDVAEVFKPLVVDRLIFTLINKKMITKKDFDRHTDGIMLTETGRRTFVSELDKRMKTTFNHRHLGKSVSYRRLIRLELYKIQKHILGEREYKPYQSLW